MNQGKIFMLLFASLLMGGAAFSQNTSVGLRIGASYYTVHNDLLDEEADYTEGLDLAIPFELKLSPLFSIQPELHYTQKGVAFEGIEDGQNQTITFQTNFLELPVLFKVNGSLGKFGYYAFAGPSVGYALKRTATEELGGVEKAKEEIDFVDEGDVRHRRWEFSAIGGVGASMKAGIGSIVMDVRYSFGLSDDTRFVNEEPADWKKTTNRGCTLSVGYMIPLGW